MKQQSLDWPNGQHILKKGSKDGFTTLGIHENLGSPNQGFDKLFGIIYTHTFRINLSGT